ncbi:hypothetical protein [Phenylobacterium sp.]|uniref:hypothetical protein n=1 Tax=Phenylobacterium sp. TaxID=1871053 RepID=UPI00286DCAE9|nr:hypothetical protein [Phenylobacterium sp.]
MRAQLTGLCLAALALSACSGQPRAMAANGNICVDFKLPKAAALPGVSADAAAVDDCVRRWAYSLAPSRDDAETVADAASAACNTQLARWNQQTLTQPGAEDPSASLITGEPTTALAEHNTFSRTRALFYVVQARAGACRPPPAKNGEPEGIT